MNQKIILKSRPEGMPSDKNFEITEAELTTLSEGEVRVKALYISVDPYMRGRMSSAKSYAEPFEVGKAIVGGVVARVTESQSAEFKKDDIVFGMMKWQQIQDVPAAGLRLIQQNDIPLGYYLGILGMPGLTAYFGLLEIGKPQAVETVVISGAAGAVGMVVCQLAKLKGCRVVGIAGSDEKLAYLKNTLKIDEVINYNTSGNMFKAIEKACPNGVDIYFDNVGGEISDAVISALNRFARVVICGQISLYNVTEMPMGPRLQPLLLKRSVLMQGFIVSNYAAKFEEAMQQLEAWVKEGKLKYTETIVEGFEKLPQTFCELFQGKNTG
ncbi:MAG: NADP-dependent oxidoreductase, partial [Lentimicrobiaceae bacterium]|nr:NADP-dependent oxidoreductase [Lentimicrobiaceae bacterium]